ncbi:PREDICTED: vomeronasal type-1 receptor 4-like [Chinchilla lanigera]|uniref:vomeronasal type-1 receptor 4-like n=1 Tax=Chinchilla lanigera TaxID=34839 RepID=UPI00038EE867|nr:PREDICTED: vomeronasal type-1 receptor 4-like [Chinchilla lanigera]
MSLDTQRNDCYSNLHDIFKGNDKITSKDLAVGIIFSSQTIIGVTANFFLLCHYFFNFQHGRRLRSTDVILKHLCLANSLVLLSGGVPQIMAAFGLKHIFSDIVCKCLLYIERVGRGVSIGTICLLSVFQNIIISPMNSCWKDIKRKTQEYIGFSIHLCWILNVLVSLIIPMYAWYSSVKGYDRIIKKKVNIGYCCLVDYGVVIGSVYIALVVVPEVCFSLLIVWASGSMISILYRHKQRVQHIHITNVSLRSPESRATQSILFLVSTFISFYTLSTIIRISIALSYNPSSGLVSASDLISLCFPTISPFLSISQCSSMFRHCFACTKNTKPLQLFQKCTTCILWQYFLLFTLHFFL